MVQEMKTLTIGQVAKEIGITVEAVRFYEKQGLIAKPQRSESGYRQYQPETLKRIRFIQRAKDVGFTLKEIDDLLTLRKKPNTSCIDIKLKALEKIENVDRKLNDLKNIRSSLTQMVMRCDANGELGDCPILEFLELEENTYHES